MSKVPSEKGSNNEEKKAPTSPRFGDSYELIGRETDDFLSKIEKEVVIVPLCTYSNEAKSASKYYLCTCSTSAKGFDLICEACAKYCHKKHAPTLEVPGANLCSCGLNNHIITPEMKEMYEKKQKGNKELSVCFYSKFFKVIPNKGFFKFQDKIYCSVCIQHCIEVGSLVPEFLDNDIKNEYQCECTKNHEINIIQLNADFISKKNFFKDLREINFNLILRLPKAKEIYIDTFIQEINNYLIKKDDESDFIFFNDILVNKSLELFSMFSVYWENKFWYILPSMLNQYNVSDLFNILSLGDVVNKLDESMVINFISGKFYFAELLFDYIIRTYTNTYCNLFNVKTILNMDLYQRLIYIHQLKVFHFYNKNPMENNYLDELVENVVDLFDNILKINERFPSLFERIISYVFPTFNRIIKYCIKYNIITEETKEKYFSLVFETLQIHHEKKLGNLRDSCFYILKSILYTLIYNNDIICYDYIQNKDTYEKIGFMFEISDESLSLTKILLSIIEDYDRVSSPINDITFDYYIQKTFELLLNKNDFYLNCVKNLDKYEIEYIENCPLINITNASQEDMKIIEKEIMKVKNCMEKRYYDLISKFCEDMFKLNRHYFEFDIEQQKYFEVVNSILTEFNNEVEKENFNMEEINISFCCFHTPNIAYNEKLNKFKNTIFYSTFFQRLEEFCHIYASSKKYAFEREKQYDQESLKDNLRKLLKLLFVLFIRDHKFLTLIMNVKPFIFATTFNDVYDTLEEFLKRIIEMIYSPNIQIRTGSHLGSMSNQEIPKSNSSNSSINNEFILAQSESSSEEEGFEEKFYCYDNFSFISDVIIELIRLNKDNYTTLGDLVLVSRKLFRKITINNSEYLNIIDAFVDIFKKIFNDEVKKEEIENYFDDLLREDRRENKTMDYFIYCYFEFMSELYATDAYFFNCAKNAEIIPEDKFEKLFESLLNKQFNGIPIEVEYGMCRYFLSIKNPIIFNFSTISKQMKNLYMKNVKDNTNILHLSLRLSKDIGVIKTFQILNYVRRITDIFSLFDKNRLKSYQNPKDLRFMFKYFENIIVRPLFSAFNMYLIDIDQARGKDIFVFYTAVFYFLKICFDFYKCPKFETKSKVSDKIVYGFDEFIVKHELTNSVLEDIYNSAKIFSDNNIGYFETERIYKIFIENVQRIIKFSFKNEITSISNTSYVSENILLNKLAKLNPYIAKREKLKILYNDLKEKKYDDNLSLIKSYQNIGEELEYNAAVPILNYLITKLFDPLTGCNKKLIDSKQYEDIIKDKVNLEKYFKFQNAYILIYLNSFFYNASEDFQEAFSSKDVQLPIKFYDFLITNIIFATNLHEIKKIYDLDFLEDEQVEPRIIGRTESLAFSTGRFAIKFIQNLCEGHNRTYQKKFFEFEFDKDEYLKDNRNIYIEGRNKNANSTYFNFIKLSRKSFQKQLELSDKNEEEKPKKTDKKKLKDILSFQQNSIPEKEKKERKEIPTDPLQLKDTIETVASNQQTQTIEQEDKELEQSLDNTQVSFFNLISYMLAMVNKNFHAGNTLDCILFQNVIKFKNLENLSELYSRLSDLIVEMIQGTDIENFKKFYSSGLPKAYRYFSVEGDYVPNKDHKIFIFLELSNQIKNILFNKNLTFDPLCYNMKYFLFTTINNILSQEGIDLSVVMAFASIFPPDDLLGVISIYLRGIYLSHYCRLNYNIDDFNKELNFLELNNIQLLELKQFFRGNPHIYNDKYFQLASQMYLFLTILAEKFNVKEAEKVKNYIQKETIESKVSDVREIIVQSNVEEDTLITKLTSLINIGSPNIKLKRVKPSDHNYNNDKIIAAKFFNKIVKKCEFRTENEGELELKIIYFICDPHYYYISKNNIQSFFKYVDRTSAKQKLQSLLENLDTFFFEIEFKKEVNRKAKYKLFFLQIDYNKINIYNFIISSLINLLLLFFLKDEERGRESHKLDYTINGIVFFQILLNVLYLYMFYISKYGFYISLLQNKLGKDHKLTLKEKINLYILDSFVLNDEIFLIFFIIITSLFGLFLKYNAFLFALQLLTIIKFIDIIREILSAFKLKLFELMEAIEVLAIIIYFVANFEFFFLIDEFNIEVGDKIENFCQNLLECTINIFNHGVRAGGGIGDLLEAKSYSDKYLYFLRFFCDLIFYIVVMLLSLNIISSIIVNTFSQIREDSNQKEEDMKNRCFICNISRIEFQKNKIDIGYHRKYEHNTNNYIKFFVFLWNIDEKDMDADQSFINDCIKEKDIKFFPMNCSKSIGEVENDDEED
jgi:hypothetical protein